MQKLVKCCQGKVRAQSYLSWCSGHPRIGPRALTAQRFLSLRKSTGGKERLDGPWQSGELLDDTSFWGAGSRLALLWTWVMADFCLDRTKSEAQPWCLPTQVAGGNLEHQVAINKPRRQKTWVCCQLYFFVLMLSCVWLFATPWTVSCQAPLSMEFPRQEYCSGLPFLSLGDLSNPGVKPASFRSPALAGGFFTTSATWGISFTIH